MQLRRKKRGFIDGTESGALSDLGFLLIIYFIVIAGFNINQGFLMSLPQKNSTKIVNVKDIMKINLLADGTIVFNNNPVNTGELKELIRGEIKNNPNMTLMFKIEPDAQYQNVVNIINLSRELDVDNFSFSMIKDIP